MDLPKLPIELFTMDCHCELNETVRLVVNSCVLPVGYVPAPLDPKVVRIMFEHDGELFWTAFDLNSEFVMSFLPSDWRN